MLIFISYSHHDEPFYRRLMTHLSPVIKGGGTVDAWSDKRLSVGESWQTEIERSVRNCDCAILLVSPEFLESDFIVNQELAPLLTRAESDSVKLVFVPVSHSHFQDDDRLSSFQTIPSAEKPLRSMTRVKQDRALLEVSRYVMRTANVSISGGRAQAASVVNRTVNRSFVPDYKANVFEDMSVNLIDLARASRPWAEGVPHIQRKIFKRCLIDGPCVVHPTRSTFENTTFEVAKDGLDTMMYKPLSDREVVGALWIDECEFDECVIQGVGFAGNHRLFDYMRTSISPANEPANG